MFPSQNNLDVDEVRQRHRASMGPGCFHPRIIAISQVQDEAGKLQWGRDVSIPECGSILGGKVSVGGLQWGRDVSIPEYGTPYLTCGTANRFNGAGMFPSQNRA